MSTTLSLLNKKKKFRETFFHTKSPIPVHPETKKILQLIQYMHIIYLYKYMYIIYMYNKVEDTAFTPFACN